MTATTAAPVLSPSLLNRAFAFAGVGRFAQLTLENPAPVLRLLGSASNLCSLLGVAEDNWTEACRAMAKLAPGFPGPFGLLLEDHKLQLHEWFALILCGECETSHSLNLALAALQAPDPSARPSLHLLEAMAQSLFQASLPPLAFANHGLVRTGILEIQGDGPLPTRQLAMPTELWALLCGDFTPWRGTHPLGTDGAALPGSLETRLAVVGQLLRSGAAQTVVFRGAPQASLAAASLLARQLGVLALQVDDATWRQRPALAPACRYGGWLPVLALRLGPGERYTVDGDGPSLVPLFLAAGPDGTVEGRGLLEVAIPALSLEERQAAWRKHLSPEAPDELAEHALVDGPTIRALADLVRLEAQQRNEVPSLAHLRTARAHYGAERLRLLAQPVLRQVGPEALVLPPELRRQFDDLVLRCRHREHLWAGLGASLAEPTPGVRVLFVGESGAGKTLAASRLATLLGAPLFRVDLSAVMNKYVGESEKNLSRVLDEAAALDAILLIDEADALFGRRTESGETGERYANMLTNFLLTRIECHPGVVVLTSNTRSRLDSAFTRRFDAILEFPLPGVEERHALWQSHLGARAPSDAFCRLLASYCDLPGGHIRNVVVNAAALSARSPADTLEPASLLAALRNEYRKLGRTLQPQLEHLKG